jgi:hypothetical protein
MDRKQFDLFQTAIQWVADEQRRKKQHRRKNGPSHVQSLWGSGKVVEWINTRWGGRNLTSSVVCASSCCLAGNIVHLHGDLLVELNSKVRPGNTTTVEHCLDEKGTVHTINERARALVGLTNQQASSLFASSRDAAQIIQQAQVIAARNGYELEVM